MKQNKDVKGFQKLNVFLVGGMILSNSFTLIPQKHLSTLSEFDSKNCNDANDRTLVHRKHKFYHKQNL